MAQREKSYKRGLRNLADRPAEERRAIASKGGHATAAKNRERKLLREIVRACGDRTVTVPVMGGGSEKTTYDIAMVLTMYREAVQEGNVRAAEFLAKISGAMEEKPAVSAGLIIQVGDPKLAAELQKAVEE